MKLKNVIIEEISKLDWLFRVGNNNLVNHVELADNWWNYKPTNETQRYTNFDPWDCTSRAKCNIHEFILNYKVKHGMLSKTTLDFLNGKNCLGVSYFDENGNINLLDKYSAILAGTVPGKGNTIKAPADIIRKYGIVPEAAYPWHKDEIDGISVDEYYNEESIQELIQLGKESLEYFNFSYEIVKKKDWHNAIKYSPIEVVVYAWKKSGQFYINTSYNFNHDTVLVSIPEHYEIFDSYSPYVKNLAESYIFMDYGYVWFIEEKKTMKLVKSSDSSNTTVYLIDAAGYRRAFYDQQHFESLAPVLGLAKWTSDNNNEVDFSQVQEISEDDLNEYPLGRPLFVVA